MKKQFIAILATVVLSSTAFADGGIYSTFVSRNKDCDRVARMGMTDYNDRVKGETRDKMIYAYGNFKGDERTIALLAAYYAYDEATSEDDAYDGGYAACMDFLTAGDQYIREWVIWRNYIMHDILIFKFTQ